MGNCGYHCKHSTFYRTYKIASASKHLPALSPARRLSSGNRRWTFQSWEATISGFLLLETCLQIVVLVFCDVKLTFQLHIVSEVLSGTSLELVYLTTKLFDLLICLLFLFVNAQTHLVGIVQSTSQPLILLT